MKNHKPLLSSAPAHSILNAREFHYTSSGDTDLRKTFARLRRERAQAAAVVSTASNVRALTVKPSEASPQTSTALAVRR